MEATKRQTIFMTNAAHEKLNQHAKRFKLTRAEVLSTILESLDIEPLAEKLAGMRASKVNARKQSAEEREKVKKLLEAMTPEQLEAVMKQAGVK